MKSGKAVVSVDEAQGNGPGVSLRLGDSVPVVAGDWVHWGDSEVMWVWVGCDVGWWRGGGARVAIVEASCRKSA